MLLQHSTQMVVHLHLLLNGGREEENYKNANTQVLSMHNLQVLSSENNKNTFIIKATMLLQVSQLNQQYLEEKRHSKSISSRK
jgi:hypothetical protein